MQFWLETGVNQLLMMWQCGDMAFSAIFSHFSHLAKEFTVEGEVECLNIPIYNRFVLILVKMRGPAAYSNEPLKIYMASSFVFNHFSRCFAKYGLY